MAQLIIKKFTPELTETFNTIMVLSNQMAKSCTLVMTVIQAQPEQ